MTSRCTSIMDQKCNIYHKSIRIVAFDTGKPIIYEENSEVIRRATTWLSEDPMER